MRRTSIVSIISFSLFSCSGQEARIPYSNPEGQFKIEFHSKPVISQKSQQFPFGNILWKFASDDKADKNNLSYSIRYADFPAATIHSDSLALLDNFFGGTQYDLLESLGEAGLDDIYNMNVQKYPGRQFRWIDQGNKLGYTRRVYLVKNRVFFLEVKYKLEENHNLDIYGFLDKFTLLNTVDNANPESVSEKPVKKFEVKFPGTPKSKETSIADETFGNLLLILEAYEVPKSEMDLPATKNIIYGVNYAKLPIDSLKKLSTAQLHQFVTSAFSDNILKQPKGKILFQKEIDLDGNWAIEGQGIIVNGMAVIHMKATIVDGYYYQAIVLSKNGSENNKEALDFLNSFKIKKAPK